MGWSRHKNVERFMGELVSSAQENYNDKWRVWVDNREEDGSRCSVLEDYEIEHYDCNLLLPYICERGMMNIFRFKYVTHRGTSPVVYSKP